MSGDSDPEKQLMKRRRDFSST